MTYPIRTFEYASIVNVVDGDTCDIEVDLGFSVKVKHRFRLAGIDTPERGKPGFHEAKDFLSAFMNAPLRRLEVTKVDKYGRYLVEIFAAGMQPEVSVNERMVEMGLAKVYGP
jgi:micrococcal nuclease